jgi:predicted O-methyltransferase YrrM
MTTLEQRLEGVEGYLHDDEPAFLASLAAQVAPGLAIVEIGAFRGRSTIALAHGAPDGVIVYSIDPHEEHTVEGLPFGMADNAAFMANVSRAGVGHKIRVLNLPSGVIVLAFQQAQIPIGLVFVDGAHDFESVESDVHFWGTRLLVNGGILALHDSSGTWADPTRVADELAASDEWTELPGCAYTRAFRKESK